MSSPDTLSQELALDMAAAVDGYEQTCEWQGRHYAIVRSNQPTDLEIVEGGFNPGVGSVAKPGIDFTFAMALSYDAAGRRGITSTAGVFTRELPAIGDLLNRGKHQIKNLGGNDDPRAVSLTVYAGSPDR